MTDVDERLREYARRWQAVQPSPVPIAGLDRGWSVRRRPMWLPVVAVAAAVTLVVLGLSLVRVRVLATGPHPAAPSTGGVVPFVALPPSSVTIPPSRQPESPDPTLAAALPACTAGDLSVTSQLDGAGGTRYLDLEVTSSTACQVAGVPAVTPLDPAGLAVPVPVKQGTGYGHPVALGGDAVAVLSLGWASEWCASDIVVASVRLTLPTGAFTVAGFGASACNNPGGSDQAPIVVTPFAPQSHSGGEIVTAFDGLAASTQVPASIEHDSVLRFTVTLTAPAGHDIPLDVCPNYQMVLGTEAGATTGWYQLNCAGVPYRDAEGHPYLPAGEPVLFAMELPVPTALAPAAKLTWQLDGVDTVAAGATVAIV